jgi:D-alanine--D-alanine ligase
MERYRVLVLQGGPSAEREISLKSGNAVASALLKIGHNVETIDPRDINLSALNWKRWDVVFNALHGTFGEDGQVQEILDRAGIPYTGSGMKASQLAFDKRAAKQVFRSHSIPTPEYLAVGRKVHGDHCVFSLADRPEEIYAVVERMGFPVVVKPNAQGSSIGVRWVDEMCQLIPAIEAALNYDKLVLIERAILGSEWTVGFIDSRPLPAIQVKSQRGWFDFEAKYEDDQTRYVFDHELPLTVQYNLYETAQRACRALGTRGVARVDLRLDYADEPWVLEVNTSPGMTDHSLVPKSAARLGMSYEDLCDLIIRRAIDTVGSHEEEPDETWKVDLLGQEAMV